ncbi:transglutaminase TgpA family protein [Halalkalibacterium ligniniphilum]|uniref:transglutaminase TgpA family protein n=1 Tax=Halalkalibacterium ligniniphilum TaxID=1134413 RepID=UPI00034D7EF2|nr:transglutaminaseTgpA domain-containing protein [Halalkalibacterium ligniniphilum]
MKTKKSLDLGQDFLLYGLSFLLLMEWLLPLPHITETGYIHLFVIFAGCYFFITFLQLPFLVSVSIKALITVYGIFLIFFDGPFFSLEWMYVFFSDLFTNLSYLLNGQWYALTDLFRSFLFFVLLAIMSYLLFYWVIYARRILFFLVFTVIYVAVLDTFTEYDASVAIIRTFIIGFLLLGLVTMYRTIEKEKLGAGSRFLPARLAAMLALVIVFSSALGFASPKLDPQWEDPVPYMRAAVGLDPGSGSGGQGVQRIGYGNNDSRLGGGFIHDDSSVFYAAATQDHYWRGETKDFYTGLGWEVSTPERPREAPYPPEYVGSGRLDYELLEAEVAFVENQRFDLAFYPGSFEGLLDLDSRIDFFTEKVTPYSGDYPTIFERYNVEYYQPSYQIEVLRQASVDDPEYIERLYLQLPETLPDRVGELAEEIVAGYDNRYDRAKAVENYFQGPDFRYETTDVAIPSEEQDYVDQFLFETQRGYCDNFSTSMAVLLRSVDIPARWVKGFTQGEVLETLDDERTIYEIKNENAHSWVEVYFPEIGWVPFEPTRGFDNAYEFIEPEEEGEQVIQESEVNETEQEQEAEDVFASMEEDSAAADSDSSAGDNDGFSVHPAFIVMVLLIAVLGILARNKKVIAFYLIFRSHRQKDEQAFLVAYRRLLWFLRYIGEKKGEHETLREYAKRIDRKFESDEMMYLTYAYERFMYGGKEPTMLWQTYQRNWERLMKKISS